MSSNPSKGPFVDAEPARRHTRNLMAAGVSIQRLARAAEVGQATVSGILYTRGTRPRAEQLRQENARRILAVRPEHVVAGRVDATGTRRRLHALMAAGWPVYRIGPYINRHPHYTSYLLRQHRVYATTAHAVATVYDQLWNQDPIRNGIVPGTAKRVRNLAASNGWAPAGAWDDDTIDDPSAHPEWTGECGTDRGYWVHKRQNLPMCARCEAAHDEWLAEHADLPGQERAKKLFAARAAASSHEADVAHDARELMRVSGLDSQQAADRLGVTRQHLQQALLRHPEAVAA